MNQKELNEIRRRFRLDKNNFSRIFGCYVNSNREVISWIDASLGLMRQEEQEMYLGLLKKTLSGTLGRNLAGCRQRRAPPAPNPAPDRVQGRERPRDALPQNY